MIKFGTAGLRGLMEPSLDGLNAYTVSLATLGISAWLKHIKPNQTTKVVLAYDTRHHSKEYATLASAILTNEGHEVYIFETYAPTPMLAYSIRPLGCDCGIVLTASHNPKDYNGYKVYGADGIQIGEETANFVANAMEMAKANTTYFVNGNCKDNLIKKLPKANFVPETIVSNYLRDIQTLWQVNSHNSAFTKAKHDLKVVYTPVHGTGAKYFVPLLTQAGFSNLQVVPEQKEPDADFPTAPQPNPEYPEVLTLAINLAKQSDAELVVASDPDADRSACALVDQTKSWHILSGNEIGALILAVRLHNAEACGKKLTADDVLVKSVVTNDFGATIALDHGLGVKESLTGFKNICGTIPYLKAEGKSFFMGYEESIGYAYPDFVRDKDGLASCYTLAMAAASLKAEGSSLWQLFTSLRKKYGYFLSSPFNIVNATKEGVKIIQGIVEKFRSNLPLNLAGGKLAYVEDYLPLTRTYYTWVDQTATVSHVLKLHLSAQNLLKFRYDNNLTVALRPSGTEPKLKFYIDVLAGTEKEAESILAQAVKEVKDLAR